MTLNGRFLSGILLLFFSLLVYGSPHEKNLPEPTSGDLELLSMTDENATVISGLHIGSEATMTISGMVATVTLKQTFSNPTDDWMEGRYVFPLPETAAVNAMEMRIGERIIKGKIKEKQEAKAIYQQAKDQGKKASLLEQHRPNLFSQKVANIAPRETIVVTLRYLQTVDYDNGSFSLRFPMTMTPRYIPGGINVEDSEEYDGNQTSEIVVENQKNKPIAIGDQGWGWSQPTTAVPDAHLITPPLTNALTPSATNSNEKAIINPIRIHVTLDAGLPLAHIDSAYHTINIAKTADQHTITLAEGQVSMDRDWVLNWQPTSSQQPQAAIFTETVNDEQYHLVMVMPPSTNALSTKSQSIPKETVLVIDTSGSMGGTSIRQAKAGLKFALQQLKKQDRFNIIEFNSGYSMLFRQPVTATPANVRRALQFTRNLRADGGTEMLSALNAALGQPSLPSHLKQIIFITDGSIGNEAQLFNAIHNQLDNARLFTVGIGSAPNSYFMRKAAEFGRGSFTYIGDTNEVNTKMSELFKKINSPTMQDLKITTPNNDKEKWDFYPNPIPDLYKGEPVVLSLKTTMQEKQQELVISGQHQNSVWQQSLTVDHAKNQTGVATLWARKKITALLDKKRAGMAEEQIKPAVLTLALQHQLLSPYTSFVAVEEKISRPITEKLKKQAIPNLAPQGQQWQTLPYPQTATSLWLNVLLASLSSLLLIYRRLTQSKRAQTC